MFVPVIKRAKDDDSQMRKKWKQQIKSDLNLHSGKKAIDDNLTNL